jgi:tetratricopeptide (TPR) repeat protein
VSHKHDKQSSDNVAADEVQVQAMLGQYRALAAQLHASADAREVEAILANIALAGEATQIALLKSLARERHSDAADVLTAFNECSPARSVRKEARRSLIRMQEQRIFPEWSVPAAPLSTLDQLLEPELAAWNAPEHSAAQGEEEDAQVDHDLEPDEVVEAFIEALAEQDFSFAFGLLAAEGSLHGGLSQEAWVSLREQWAGVAQPRRLELSFTCASEAPQDEPWVVQTASPQSEGALTELDSGWSLELAAQAADLPELPQSTIAYAQTGRHWFWTRYTLVREEQGWRITHVTNAGLIAHGLSRDALQQRITQHDERIEKITQQHQPTDPDADRYIDEIMWRSLQIIYYDDALLKQMPLERSLYLDAAGRAVLLGENELSLVYLERAANTFSDLRADALRQIAAIRLQLSQDCFSEGDDDGADDGADDDAEDAERGERFHALAIEALRESLSLEANVMTYLMLAQALLESGEEASVDEAENLLLQAGSLPLTPAEEANVATTLGEVFVQRDEYGQALDQYRRAVRLVPDFPAGWYNVGRAYRLLERDEQAVAAFRQAIEVQDDDMESYAELTDIYLQHDQHGTARSLLNAGRKANPDSALLAVLLASTYMESDTRRAASLLDEAEEIDPGLEIIQLYRQTLTMLKAERQPRKKARKKR